MVLKELRVVNFKNIAEATLAFTPGFNCFIGKNGAGKTNVLDAGNVFPYVRRVRITPAKADIFSTETYALPAENVPRSVLEML